MIIKVPMWYAAKIESNDRTCAELRNHCDSLQRELASKESAVAEVSWFVLLHGIARKRSVLCTHAESSSVIGAYPSAGRVATKIQQTVRRD
jgi:hypothetical protein